MEFWTLYTATSKQHSFPTQTWKWRVHFGPFYKKNNFSTKSMRFFDAQNICILGAETIVRFILVKSLTNIPKWHSGKYANDFSSYFRNNGIWLRKFILNTIYSGVTVRTSLWLMEDKNKVLLRWIELCVYIHKLCKTAYFT